MIFGLILGQAASLNISLAKSAIMLTGTPTDAIINWDPNVVTNFTLLFSPNGRETPTLAAAGIAVKGNTWYYVSVTGTGNPTQISGTNEMTAATAGKITITPLATVYTDFAILADRVYPVCVYTGVMVNTSLTGKEETGCGTFHTFTSQSTFTGNIDRNLGNYMGSKTLNTLATDTTRTANSYNFTMYASKSGGIATGSINAAVVAFSTGTATDFVTWSAISIGSFTSSITSSMDYMGSILTGAPGDYYSKTGVITAAKPDNDSSLNCPNDVSAISFGKATTSGALSAYSHFTRKFVTTDLSCDNSIISGVNSLCALYKEGTSAGVTAAFATVQDDFFCATFAFSSYLSAILVVLALLY
jgi:hypothetical protein